MRWSALEAMTALKFTASSDAYSFGCTMFEVYQAGDPPWAEYVESGASTSVSSAAFVCAVSEK